MTGSNQTPSQQTLIEQIRAAHRASVPIVAVSTPDPAATIQAIVESVRNPAGGSGGPGGSGGSGGEPDGLRVEWDLLRGYHPRGSIAQIEQFHTWVSGADIDLASLQFNPVLAVAVALKLPDESILFVHLANRFLAEPPFIQAVWNLRDAFKANLRMLVLLGPSLTLPAELAGDVVALDEPLPGRAALAQIVREAHEHAELTMIPQGTIDRAVDAVQGLPAFAAEQVVAMSLRKSGVDLAALWERKRQQIEQTPGLKVWRGGETFAAIGGVQVVKEFVGRVMSGSTETQAARPNAVVFIDEIEKMMAGAAGGGDTSGVSQDQLGTLLSYMQDTSAAGMIFVGPPGSAKSMVAKAAGQCAGVPTIQLDLGAAKGSLVGQSEQQLRHALKVVTAVSSGKSLWIATCNSISDLPPELRRRFTLGTFFFELPTAAERAAIWDLWLSKFGLEAGGPGDRGRGAGDGGQGNSSELGFSDAGWTGAEIKQCCEIAWRLGCPLSEAASFVVPVSRSASEQLAKLRQFATGRFLSASYRGVYRGPEEERGEGSGARGENGANGKARRKISV